MKEPAMPAAIARVEKYLLRKPTYQALGAELRKAFLSKDKEGLAKIEAFLRNKSSSDLVDDYAKAVGVLMNPPRPKPKLVKAEAPKATKKRAAKKLGPKKPPAPMDPAEE